MKVQDYPPSIYALTSYIILHNTTITFIYIFHQYDTLFSDIVFSYTYPYPGRKPESHVSQPHYSYKKTDEIRDLAQPFYLACHIPVIRGSPSQGHA